MKSNELVWRTLADHALAGNRTWSNVGDLAYEAGVPISTAYLALDRLDSNGAIDRYKGGGLSVVSIEKVLTMQCAWRNLDKDTVVRTTREAIQPFLNSEMDAYALGGPDAANALLKGKAVSDFSEHLVYVPSSPELLARLGELPAGKEVRVLTMDRRATKMWRGYSSLAQTYADLFATPGWQASEFRNALRESFMHGREWDQAGDAR